MIAVRAKRNGHELSDSDEENTGDTNKDVSSKSGGLTGAFALPTERTRKQRDDHDPKKNADFGIEHLLVGDQPVFGLLAVKEYLYVDTSVSGNKLSELVLFMLFGMCI